MDGPVPRSEYPWWVKLSIWGVPGGRAGVFAFVVFSLACALGCLAAGVLVHPVFLGGGLFVYAALMYWLAMRWIDRHGSWGPDPGPADPDGFIENEP